MELKKALQRIREIREDLEGVDQEELHRQLDKLLTDILDAHGYNELTEIFWEIDKWYA